MTCRLPKDSLSPRETEICKLLAEGASLREVALHLRISVHSADYHVRNAYLKLGVHDRSGLVRRLALPNVSAVRDRLMEEMWPARSKPV
jgi:DNA-binding CsgD family transcriptional regulator